MNNKPAIVDIDKKEKVNVKAVSLGAAFLSSMYQYNLMQKSKKKYRQYSKIGMCSGAFVICYFMTNFILTNINEL